MKKAKKALSVLLVLLLLVLTVPFAFAVGGTDDDITWDYNTSTKTLTILGSGDMGDYGYYEKPWSRYCDEIKTVVILSGVTSIGGSAFFGCKAISSITIPSSVKSIGESAFYGCSALESIEIPESVTAIGDTAFGYCSSLKSVNLPSKLKVIEEMLFSDCSLLESVNIPDGVTKIDRYAFNECSSLSSITIPASVTFIGSCVFLSCSKLKTINYAGSAAQWSAIEFGDSVFAKNEEGEYIPVKAAVVLPGFVNLPFCSDGLKDKDWYFDFSGYVAYSAETFGLQESYPGELEKFYEEAMALTTLQFNPATETIMYTSVDSNGKAELSEVNKEDADGYNAYRTFIKQYRDPTQPENPGGNDNPQPQPQQQQSGSCKYCGEDHTGFLGFFVKIFHSILALFGLRKK